MRLWGQRQAVGGAVLALLLAAGACKQQDVDRNASVADIDLNKVVTEAKVKADRQHPDAKAPHARDTSAPGYAWVGNWSRRRTLCPFRKWVLTRTSAVLPTGESCTVRSAKGDPLGGDRLELACSTAGMKTDELWFAKFIALDQLRLTRTAGAGIPNVVTLARCG